MSALFGQGAVLAVLAKIGKPATLKEIVDAAPADLYAYKDPRCRRTQFCFVLGQARKQDRVTHEGRLWALKEAA